MFRETLKQFKPALLFLLVLTVLTGVIYPMAVTGAAQVFFPKQANGSLVMINDKPAGSELIGQAFSAPKYFWSRPSATGPFPNNAGASTGSNLGPTNADYLKAVKDRVDALHAADPENTEPVPVDLVTASGSGLDPHISPAAAEYQIHRVAKAREPDEKRARELEGRLRELVAQCTEGRQLGILGEARVNVLRLNLALDNLAAKEAL
ncbi:MAG: potassium-transporting ATPase subunit KdpC [Planctomycetes bacterium]|nr:potassium-transporting ATPase subunit KdpC [Planctomycetota bacterium]